MHNEKLTGLTAAPFTPMRDDGEVALDRIEPYAAALVEQGVTGAFICGTTGEGVALTMDERMSLAGRWCEAAGPSLRVIVHVGHNSLTDACALAEHAAAQGAFAIAAMPPYFFKPTNDDDLLRFLAPIAQAGDGLPFYYYHIPSMTRVELAMDVFMERADEAIPTFRGIKYTHNDLMEYRRCLTLAPDRFDVPFGSDELLLPALSMGARGAVGSTYNYAAWIYHELIEAYRRHDIEQARCCADRSAAVVRLLMAYGVLRVGKALMGAIGGVECGPPRPPVAPLTPAERRGVCERLLTEGILPRKDVADAVA